MVWRFNHAGRVVLARLDLSGRPAFTADSRQASIWDLTTGKELSRLQFDHRFEVYTAARFANDGKWLITGALPSALPVAGERRQPAAELARLAPSQGETAERSGLRRGFARQ